MKTVVHFVVLLVIVVQIQAASNDDWNNEPVSTFIANGSVSEYVPYMVSIRTKAKEAEGFGFGHFCGGVLITKSHVLTLGSCINNGKTVYKPNEINLVLGSRNRYDQLRTLIATPSQIRVHPEFNYADILNNIAIITLQNPIESGMNVTVSPVSISNTTISLGSKCDIMGWATPFSSNGTKELMKGSVNVVNTSLCFDFANRVCAGPDNIRGCPGDDGGPLICNNKVYGLIDFKNIDHCKVDNRGRYEYYINVADYYKWIMEVIGTTTNTTTTIGTITTNATTPIPPMNITTTMPSTNATTPSPITNATTPITTTTTRKSTGNNAVNTVASVLMLTLTVILSIFAN
ncbi:unnamed protein product [Diamesa tonsa]